MDLETSRQTPDKRGKSNGAEEGNLRRRARVRLWVGFPPIIEGFRRMGVGGSFPHPAISDPSFSPL